MKYLSFILIANLLLLFSCEEDLMDPHCATNTFEESANDLSSNSTELVQSIESFGWDLFQILTEELGKDTLNPLVSPFSIATALYMTHQAAMGDTKAEIAEVLHVNGLADGALNPSYHKLKKALLEVNDFNDFQTANALFWDHNRFKPSKDYLEEVCKYYELYTASGSFDKEKDTMVAEMNQWVSDATDGKLENLFKKIEKDEIVFLINAIAFSAQWEHPIMESTTSDQSFYLSPNEIIQVPTMSQDYIHPHYIGPDLSVLKLAFKDQLFQMSFILPPADKDIREWVKETDYAEIQQVIKNELVSKRLMIKIPKFKIKSDLNLNNYLQILGMKKSFDNRADFSPLGQVLPEKPLVVNRVIHQATLAIDEKGVEAAAATAVAFSIRDAPPILQFNRPFLVFLNHQVTGVPLFIGLIEDPSATK